MYSLTEIKEIRRKYKFNENGEIQSIDLEKSKNPSEMTEEEKSYIESALFLYRIVRNNKDEIFSELSNEEFLEQLQTQFENEALSKREYSARTLGITTKPCEVIWKSLLMEENGAMTFFKRVLAENGKKIQNIEKDSIKGLEISIKYDLIDDNKDKFLQSLNPNNPDYTQNEKPKELTQEQIQRRRAFVDKLMQVYRECETDEKYNDRANREEKDMSFVVRTINSNTSIERIPEPAKERVMDLLYAAQNVSLTGEKDYLSEIINQPIISDFLLQLRNSHELSKMT